METPGSRWEGALELLANLDCLAAAGGTHSPFLIDTGDQTATEASLSAAIDAIRGSAASCEGGTGWRFDDPVSPRTIELCRSRCEVVQQDASQRLVVDFLCEPRPPIVR